MSSCYINYKHVMLILNIIVTTNNKLCIIGSHVYFCCNHIICVAFGERDASKTVLFDIVHKAFLLCVIQ